MALDELIEMFKSDDKHLIFNATSNFVEMSKVEDFECQIDHPRQLRRAQRAIKVLEQSQQSLNKFKNIKKLSYQNCP